ncbi:MBL fold metallo-hydrolase [Deinococcus aquaticus]|uniref:MBL fold metallo-hydrolase n=1 Tax=Deinococcus aquaticus TaxID=328692 RepID=UPI003616874D
MSPRAPRKEAPTPSRAGTTKTAAPKATPTKASATAASTKAAAAKTGSTRASSTKASTPKASSAKAGARTGRRAGKGRSGPSSSDLLGVLVLVVTGSLAACGWIRNQDGGSDAPTSGPATTAPAGAQVTIRFLDVGQGDAILIRSPEGKTALIDGGRSAERLSDQLEKYGVTRLDLMIATHADADHIAGLVPAAALKPRLFINNGMGGTTRPGSGS